MSRRACHERAGLRRLRFEPLEERRLLSVSVSTVSDVDHGGLVAVRVEEVGQAVPDVSSGRQAQPDLHTVAYDFEAAHRGGLGLSADSDFAVRSVFTGIDGLAHVRLDQQIDGVISTITRTARLLRSTLDSMATPCSVKAYGG